MADKVVETSSGGGAVKVTATCDGIVKSIKIDPDAVDADDISMLEDMVLGAVNQVLEQGREIQASEMGKLTGGMGGMGGMGMMMIDRGHGQALTASPLHGAIAGVGVT